LPRKHDPDAQHPVTVYGAVEPEDADLTGPQIASLIADGLTVRCRTCQDDAEHCPDLQPWVRDRQELGRPR
jgi:hypothetical protein